MYLKEIYIVDIDVSVLREMIDVYYNYKKNLDFISIRGVKIRYFVLMKVLRFLFVFDVDDKRDYVDII